MCTLKKYVVVIFSVVALSFCLSSCHTAGSGCGYWGNAPQYQQLNTDQQRCDMNLTTPEEKS